MIETATAIKYAPAIVSLAKKPIEDIYEFLKKQIKVQFAGINIDDVYGKALGYVEANSSLITILCRERRLVSDFYYPSKVIFDGVRKGTKVTVDNLDDLILAKGKNRLIIEAAAGHGKSVFLRHLFVEEYKVGRVAILINLREINDSQDLIKILFQQFDDIGLPLNNNLEYLNKIVASAKVTLLLDGLDEVERKFVMQVRDSIKFILNKNTSTRVVISSRPGALLDFMGELPDSSIVRLAKN
ncbi:NACHT domain-containing NTPase [Deefgea sp. CFH1-16]|uniref:NACHT domain-containing protein n=1 Tax=Deefgea sp. CFH1-16 TaxID=2675457 RepID=UPI0015F434D2|nr:NACHT domain-containing protein [Deefgea sp. CFH1-16]